MKENNLLKLSHRLKCSIKLTLFALLITAQGTAKGEDIRGQVIAAEDSVPIIGATIMIDGGSAGTLTDIDGNFELKGAPATGTFTVSCIGYIDSQHTITKGESYIIKLESDTKMIDEVVVVGYGTMRKKEVTGAVARVDMSQINKISTADVGSSLQGQIAGVNVQASSGQPGSVSNIQIRGISSVTGSNQPLYIVDGVPFDGDPGLSSSEIASIDVLKDAASAAIYGTRGAGGVILITTKGGKKGEAKVSLDAYYGVQNITSQLHLANAAQSMYITALSSPEYLPSHQVLYTTLAGQPLNYLNDSKIIDVIEQNNQPIYNISANVSGGTDDVVYSFVANYFDQEGVVYNSGFDRLNLRANATLTRGKWEFTTNLSVRNENQERADGGLYNFAYSFSPFSRMFDPDDSINDMGTEDPYELLSSSYTLQKFKSKYNQENRSYNANFLITYNITEDLTFSNRVGTNYSNVFVVDMDPLFEMTTPSGDEFINPALRSSVSNTTIMSSNLTWESMLNYAHKWGKHDLKATAVFSAEQYNTERYTATSYDLITNDLPTIGATTGDMVISGGPNRQTTIVGMLGRAQYNYDDRYLMSVSVRRDGSSRFAEKNRWGVFPSVSAGWNISEEDFWQPLQSKINTLKLRASMGTTGNQNFGDYTAYATIISGFDYAFGDQLGLGSIQTAFANAEVQWETTQQMNLGIDAALLDCRLSLTADIYRSNKRNMLFGLTVPPVAGGGTSSSVTLNVGDMVNKGIELAIGWRDKVGEVTYSVNTTFSHNENIVTSMPGTTDRVILGSIGSANGSYNLTYLSEGYEAGAYFVYPTDGIINTDEELQEYQKLEGKAAVAKMGDLKYVDTKKDNKITEEDRVYAGCGAPDAEFGLNATIGWKAFDFSMNWYSSIGNEIINGSRMIACQRGRAEELVYQWSNDNMLSTIPNTIGGMTSTNYKGDTDMFVEDGSFVRLKNIVLGYTMPQDLIKRAGLSKVRFYVAADNIWTITAYTGYDPEVGNDGLAKRGLDAANYPISAQIRGGVQVNF